MNYLTSERIPRWVVKFKFLLALSRTPHALLDMTTPGLASLLCLGKFPPFRVITLGLLTVFAGYTAVYALNDVMDHNWDRKKINDGKLNKSENDLDSMLAPHPLAQGLLTLKESLIWVVCWSMLAIAGAYILNPVCVYVFVVGCVLEMIYCLLWRVSYMKTIVSGVVKSSGSIAAVFAVENDPSLIFLVLLFLWLFFWEIGGQNVPNDWADIDEDYHLNVKTVPTHFGPRVAYSIIVLMLILSMAMGIIMLFITPYGKNLTVILTWLLVGFVFLIHPLCRLNSTKTQADAQALFNMSSYYHLVLLMIIGFATMMRS